MVNRVGQVWEYCGVIGLVVGRRERYDWGSCYDVLVLDDADPANAGTRARWSEHEHHEWEKPILRMRRLA